MNTAAQIVEAFAPWDLDEEARRYLHFHRDRFARLIRLAHDNLGPRDREPRILDVGPSFPTELLRRAWPHATVDSLGFGDDRFPPRIHERHIELNLDHALEAAKLPPPEPVYDLIVCAEVIEHLHVPPRPVLEYLRQHLSEGGRLLLQTPNAGALGKRLRMLRGRHPFEALRETPRNPGHVRESTREELEAAADSAGLRVLQVSAHNDFGARSFTGRVLRAVGRMLPSSFRDDLSLVLATR